MNTILFIHIVKEDDEDATLFGERVNLYIKAVEKHNKMVDENHYYDSGFDIYQPHMPEAKRELKNGTYKVGLGIKGAMYSLNSFVSSDKFDLLFTNKLDMCLESKFIIPEPYQIFPRSSIYKKSFRLANSTGIIDTGYRGNLGALIDNNTAFGTDNPSKHKLIPHERYFQICKPDLKSFKVYIVNNLPSTARGEGGFGSTGK